MICLCGCTSTDWSENYDPEGSNPFDLLALRELLSARAEGLQTLRDTADLHRLDSVGARNYLFVGQYPYYSDEAITDLLDYVSKGNNAFIVAKQLPEDLLLQLFTEDCYDPEQGGLLEPAFPEVYLDSLTAFRYPRGDSFKLVNTRFWVPVALPLQVIPEVLLCNPDRNIQALGTIDSAGINFIRVDRGAGAIYLHTNPIFFTNWFLVDSTQYRYAQDVLGVIRSGPTVWDEASRRYRRSASQTGQQASRDYTGGRNLLSGNDTLRYIQEHRALAFSWYTLLVGALLYVLFRGKRRQRVIPLLPARVNSSKRFIDTISRLVHEKGNHAALAQRELASLRFHLNARFGVRWGEGRLPPDDLSERIGLPADVTERALAQIRLVAAGRPLEEGDLLRFYRAIEPLYRL
ncbi:DUF4350 domain-containing protein [Lewinella sp. IMCC34191]|uniref:DUF4350 domain-containing protein n=1 Tax=Lewinella sp. IMCC34191 TaxID=2259172 RepID=UPI0013003638|nr:DUF4350 domain-containing protein [Lewinella sp. IMCC34191]